MIPTPASFHRKLELIMKKILVLSLAIGLTGCGDFVDEDGNTSIRQVAQGLKTLGDRVVEMGEALERDAGVEAVAWEDLVNAIPTEVDGTRLSSTEGDESSDREGAGLSIAHAHYAVQGDSAFVGVADLGALRSGAALALRWAAPLFGRDDMDGEIEEIEVAGYPAIQVRNEKDDDLLVAVLVAGRFAVIAGADGRIDDDFVWDALAEVDFGMLEDWKDYGTN